MVEGSQAMGAAIQIRKVELIRSGLIVNILSRGLCPLKQSFRKKLLIRLIILGVMIEL